MTADGNPNVWLLAAPHEFRVYLDDYAQTWAVLDEEDYHWAVQWRWHENKPHRNRSGKKRYACRSQSNGRRYAPKLYLHVEIMKRSGVQPPSPMHNLVDHRDGDEFNCRRSNLRWVTPAMNRNNRFGGYPADLCESMVAGLGGALGAAAKENQTAAGAGAGASLATTPDPRGVGGSAPAGAISNGGG